MLEQYLLLDESRRNQLSGIQGPSCCEMTVSEVMHKLNFRGSPKSDWEKENNRLGAELVRVRKDRDGLRAELEAMKQPAATN